MDDHILVNQRHLLIWMATGYYFIDTLLTISNAILTYYPN
jgi:hypothetical protein